MLQKANFCSASQVSSLRSLIPVRNCINWRYLRLIKMYHVILKVGEIT